jgi:AraC-like DNA-binding protein
MYREHRPSTALAPFIECYWTRSGLAEPSAAHRVLPDGCLDLLFSAEPGRDFRPLCVGAMTVPLLVAPAIPTNFLGVRFRPGKAYGFFGTPAGALTDLVVSAADVGGLAGVKELATALSEMPPGAARLFLLDRFLLSRLSVAAERQDPRVAHAVRAIWSADGSVRIDALAGEVGLTRQHLARRFLCHVGLSPKQLARVARFRAAMRALSASRPLPAAAIAADLGYADQAHMVREFAEFSGHTPARWRG